jgi:hypothetical protein
MQFGEPKIERSGALPVLDVHLDESEFGTFRAFVGAFVAQEVQTAAHRSWSDIFSATLAEARPVPGAVAISVNTDTLGSLGENLSHAGEPGYEMPQMPDADYIPSARYIGEQILDHVDELDRLGFSV